MRGSSPLKPELLTETLPPEPAAPLAPLMTTAPWVMVRPDWVFAPVSVSVLLPTLVRRKAPEIAPERVMSPPAVPPVTALT